jgi:hypothetical protein
MPLKKFALVDPNDYGDDDPIRFQLGDEPPFTCLPDVPAAAIHALVTRGPTDGMFAFLRGALIADDEDRFDALLARKDVLVDDGTLNAVLSYVSEAFTNRPTRRSSSSQDGPLTTNDGSPGSSPLEASTGQ